MKLVHQIILAFTLIIVLSVTDSITNYRLSLQVRQNTDYLATSEAIIRNSSLVHKSIIEMQSGFRGFLLTDDTSFLEPYNSGIKNTSDLFSELRQLVGENNSQKMLLDTILGIHNSWIEYANSLISAKRSFMVSSDKRDYTLLFETRLRKQVGKKMNDEIAIKFQEFDRSEYKVRALRREQLIASIDTTHRYSLTFLALTILIGFVSTLYIVRIITKRIASMVQLAESISKGQFTIVKDKRHDELTGLSTSLNIMSERLSKNIQELESRNSELNQFAYVVSHDLKAPIRGIYNVIQWIEEDLGHDLSPQMRKYISIIPQRTKRMEDLINGLLDYARLGEKTEKEKVDVNELVKQITGDIVPRDFEVITVNLPLLFAERLKLEQVFSNLISNAVKYASQENARIIISSMELPGHYEFSVKDNGIGIDPEYHEKIFEIFQTLREKDEKASTGIGLAIAKKIIDDLHCTIRVVSKAGEGAEFIFTWPKIYIEK